MATVYSGSCIDTLTLRLTLTIISSFGKSIWNPKWTKVDKGNEVVMKMVTNVTFNGSVDGLIIQSKQGIWQKPFAIYQKDSKPTTLFSMNEFISFLRFLFSISWIYWIVLCKAEIKCETATATVGTKRKSKTARELNKMPKRWNLSKAQKWFERIKW